MSNKTLISTRLSKSTKITFFSCLGFVALTCLILVFFIFFPITPSERIMASIGRENVFNNGSGNNDQKITPSVITTSNDEAEEATTTKPVSTTTRTVNIKITTGSGFLWNGRIPTGVMSGNTYTTPVYDDPKVPTYDPGYNGDEPSYPQGELSTDPETPQIPNSNEEPGNEVPAVPNVPQVDPNTPPETPQPSEPIGGGNENNGNGNAVETPPVEPSPNPNEENVGGGNNVVDVGENSNEATPNT